MRRLWLVLAGLALAVLPVLSGGQGRDEAGLTLTNFRAPEFPAPETNIFERSGANPPSPELEPGRAGGILSPPPSGVSSEPGTPNVSGDTWINSPPLTMAQLRGKVVLIDFWEYTCINCIRTFADNKKWYERYHPYGFQIIGVHDPEFDIAYPIDHVRVAVKRFGLPYPVVVDDSFRIWNEYHNNTWPNRFLIDATGTVRYNRAGEGADRAFDLAIQKLLQEAHPGLTFPASYSIPAEKNPFDASCGIPTAEMYVGNWEERGILANPEGYRRGKTVSYNITDDVRDGQAAVAGAWQTDRNGMVYRGKRKKGTPSDDRLEMRYHARELYSVMNVAHGHPQRLYIQQDGKDLTNENKGADVRIDGNGRSYIEVREPRMYYLVQNPSFDQHKVTLAPTAAGITINSFTFGNNCQTEFPHL